MKKRVHHDKGNCHSGSVCLMNKKTVGV